MIKVIVEVEDPFSLRRGNADEPALLVGSLVDVEIFGETLEDAVAVDRTYVHDGDTVWLMDDDDKLVIGTIEPAYKGDVQVVVTEGLADGDRLVTSHLAAPVEGMPLRLRGGTPAEGEAAGEAPPGATETGEVPGR